jgi:hypothetical protein
MKQNKYEVVIIHPSTKEETKKLFSSRQEVADFLEVKVSTIYGLQRNTLKLSQESKSKLQNVKINKLHVIHQHNKPKLSTEEYVDKLLLKSTDPTYL